MAAPTKQSSRWGSLLQQAVAGVESRLDNILAEGAEENTKRPANTPTVTVKPDIGISRGASNSSKTNDRLQERLARAIAAKNTLQKADSLALSSTPPRTGSPISASESPRRSIDALSTGNEEKTGRELPAQSEITIDLPSENGEKPTAEVQVEPPPIQLILQSQLDLNGPTTKIGAETPRFSTESARSSIPRDSIDSVRQQHSGPVSPVHHTEVAATETADLGLPLNAAAEHDAVLKQLQSDFETSELQHQEEVHGYIERIDALQAKLQYLARESIESARKPSTSAAAGSLEKKLADKEEQVALLMEEGQQLSKKELAHLATIKKLRAKIQGDSKEVAEAKRKQEKAETDAASALDSLRRAEGSDKRLNEKLRLISQLQRDIESLKSERDAKESIIVGLRTQVDEVVAHEKQAETEAKIANEALNVERKRAADLEDDVANLRIEKSLVGDRAQALIKELREQMEKDAERARITELEMKTEQQVLESKLEVIRARAEEVSSGATGDAQAKLLRQIETLQTQYAVASENWQGIESSLTARATSLEKERDEATRREADIRRKAREVTLKAKRNEDELEETRSKLPSFQQELAAHKAQLQNLQRRAEVAESALMEARAVFDQQKLAWKSEMQQRLDEERQKWQEEMLSLGSHGHSRAESPVTSTRRGLTPEFLGLQNLQIRRQSPRSITSDVPTGDRFLARRPSALPLSRSPGYGTPPRHNSIQSFAGNGEIPETPSFHTDNDDFFENMISPSPPQQTLDDMVSASTAGAGPSVQLVERMSSAVRRLESEKVATKEDLARLSAQRDEARAEIVSLMKEVGAKRATESKVAELEAEVAAIKARYETTLEMLGEKSEMVEELRSDIDDIKAMYRELVERTVK